MPEADGAAIGGAIDFTKRIEFEGTAISPTTQLDVVSSSASDTATKCQVMYRDATGVVQTPAAVTLNGQTKVVLTATAAERLLAGVVTGGAIAGLANPGGTTAVGDVAIMAHTLTISAHTMQTGAANAAGLNPAIAKLQSGDGASCAAGMVLHTTGGTGPNQLRRILAINPNGLGADFVSVDRNWGTVPDNTTIYEVAHGMHFELGASNAGVLLGTATQVLAITRLYTTAAAQASGGSQLIFYEKVFLNNNNTATALTSAQIEALSEAPALPVGALLDLALTKILNDGPGGHQPANRQTLPTNDDTTALTFVTQPALVSVIGNSGNLPASAGAGNAAGAQAVWLRLTLPSGTAAYEGVVDLRSQGNTV